MLSMCYCLHVCMSARRFLSSYSALLSPCRLQDASCFAHEPGALHGSKGGWHVCPPLSIYSRCHPCALTLPCPPCMFVWGPLSCLCGIYPITPFPLVHRLCLSGGLSWVVHLRYALHVPVSILHLCKYPNPAVIRIRIRKSCCKYPNPNRKSCCIRIRIRIRILLYTLPCQGLPPALQANDNHTTSRPQVPGPCA